MKSWCKSAQRNQSPLSGIILLNSLYQGVKGAQTSFSLNFFCFSPWGLGSIFLHSYMKHFLNKNKNGAYFAQGSKHPKAY